jgi:uridine kinase
MKRVILESPFAGNTERNINYARLCLRDSLLRGEAPIASHLLYTQPNVLDDKIKEERNNGILAGLAWGCVAEATVVYTDFGISKGMQGGIERARLEKRLVEYRQLLEKKEDLPMRMVIGLIGENRSGKGTFVEILKAIIPSSITIVRIGFSDAIKETLKIWNISLTRENLQILPQVMDQCFGKGSLSKAVKKQIENRPENIVIADGVRWLTDAAMIRQFHPYLFVYLTANSDKRFERLKSSNEKFGESDTTFDQFLNQEKAPNEVLIPQIGAEADFKIENNGTPEEYQVKIKEFYEKFLLPHLPQRLTKEN